MLNIKSVSLTKKILIVVTLLASALVATSGAAFASVDKICIFVKQLQDPEQSYNFSVRVAAARQASTSQYGELYVDQAVMISRNGEEFDVDSFSFDCLSCHDGSTSSSHDISYKSASKAGIFSGGSLSSHPIGMHYGSASYVNSGLRKLESLNPNMLFVDGKVGCLSCHNPLNVEGAHLVADNQSSNLCLTCHAK